MDTKENSLVPKQCQKCPVLAKYKDVLAETDRIIDINIENEHKFYAKSDDADNPSLRSLYKVMGETASSNIESMMYLREKYEEELVMVGGYVDDECPGTSRGSFNNGLAKVIDIIKGSRLCHNSGFDALESDPGISEQILAGNWDPQYH